MEYSLWTILHWQKLWQQEGQYSKRFFCRTLCNMCVCAREREDFSIICLSANPHNIIIQYLVFSKSTRVRKFIHFIQSSERYAHICTFLTFSARKSRKFVSQSSSDLTIFKSSLYLFIYNSLPIIHYIKFSYPNYPFQNETSMNNRWLVPFSPYTYLFVNYTMRYSPYNILLLLLLIFAITFMFFEI